MRFKRRNVLIVLQGVLAVVAVAIGYYWWSHTAPPMPEDMEQARAVLASNRFANLPDERKDAYFDRIRELMAELPDDERRAVWQELRQDEQFREARMRNIVRRAREFAMAPPDQKEAVLDRHMAEFMSRPRPPRRERGQDQPPDPERQAERRQQRRDHMTEQMNTGDPQDHAMISEYFRAMRERWRNNR